MKNNWLQQQILLLTILLKVMVDLKEEIKAGFIKFHAVAPMKQ